MNVIELLYETWTDVKSVEFLNLKIDITSTQLPNNTQEIANFKRILLL